MKKIMRISVGKNNDNRGFTLIETMISMFLVATMALASLGMIAFFAKNTKTDTIHTCLLQAASSGIEAKRANPAANSFAMSCAGYNVNVTITGGSPPTVAPAMGTGVSACVEITSTAVIDGKSMQMRDWICNFPEG